MNMQQPLQTVLALLLTSASLTLTGADWTRFRGPNGSAVSQESNLPTIWSDHEDVDWKTELPGPGSSSPITVGDRIFLTCYSGYGRDGGSTQELKRHIVCLSRDDGSILWQKSIRAKLPEAAYRPPGVSTHGYSSSTPTSDGERVFAFFGKTGIYAWDLEGQPLWNADVGSQLDRRNFGSGASPVVYKNLVIVNALIEGQAIVALDKRTGKQVWNAPAAGYGGSWSTPILIETESGETELTVAVTDEVWGLNPDNGKLRWYAVTNQGQPICPSLVANDGIVFALGGRSGGCIAIRSGGKGDVTKTHVVWTSSAGSYVPSPVIHAGHLYWSSDRGIAYCLNAKTGDIVYQERLDGARSIYASAIVAAGNLYVPSRNNGTFVLAAQPEFKQLAHNEFEEDTSTFNASLVVSRGQLLLRSDRFLYCIGKK